MGQDKFRNLYNNRFIKLSARVEVFYNYTAQALIYNAYLTNTSILLNKVKEIL